MILFTNFSEEWIDYCLWEVKQDPLKCQIDIFSNCFEKNNGNLFLIFSVMAEKFPGLATFEITEGTTYFNETIK